MKKEIKQVNTIKTVVILVFLILNQTLLAQVKRGDMEEGLLVFHNLFYTGIKDTVACYRIPTIATAPNGDLVAVIDERVSNCNDLNGNKNINIVSRISKDNGKTWSDVKTVIDFPYGKSASDPSIIVDNITKELFLFYNYMDYSYEKDVYFLHVVKSKDNGQTWSDPIDITSQITKPEWHKEWKFMTSGAGIQTKSGQLLHVIDHVKRGAYVFGSNDHGKTWFFIDTPINPADESKIVELNDGSWMLNSRVNKAGIRYVHISKDNGITWQSKADSNLIDPGCNAGFIRYTSIKNGDDKNRLLLANINSKNKRQNIVVRISYDEGKTWTEAKTIYSGSAAYSSITVLKNGEIGLFFEKDDYKENVFVSFSLEWLTDGKDKNIKTNKSKHK